MKLLKTAVIVCCLFLGYITPASDYRLPQEITDMGFSPSKAYTEHEDVYINPVTGNYKTRATDLRLSWWNGFDLVIERYYDSTLHKSDNDPNSYYTGGIFSLGKGWRLGLPYIRGWYTEQSGKTGIDSFLFSVTLSDGQVFNVKADMTITYDGRNAKSHWEDGETTFVSFQCHFGGSDFNFISYLEYDVTYDGWFFDLGNFCTTGFSIIMKDGIRYEFDGRNLTTIRDSLGYKCYKLIYWEGGGIKQITDGRETNPRTLDFSHNGNYISYIGMPDDDYGRGIEYNQDSEGNLVCVKSAGNGVFRTWNYGYTTVGDMPGKYLYTLTGPDIEQVRINLQKMALSSIRTVHNSTNTIDISRAVVDNFAVYKKVPYYSSFEELARTIDYQYVRKNITYYSEGTTITEDYLDETIESISDPMQEWYGIGLSRETRYLNQAHIVPRNNSITYLVPLEASRTTYISNEADYQEKITTSYTADLRLLSQITKHQTMEISKQYSYDNWGNITMFTGTTLSGSNWSGAENYGQVNQKVVMRMSYLLTSSVDSSHYPWWKQEDFYRASPFTQELIPPFRFDLLNCKVVENWVPDINQPGTFTQQYLHNAYTYNNRGQLKKEACWSGSSWNETASFYDYETASAPFFGSLTRLVDAEGAVTSFIYDGNGFLMSSTREDVTDIDGNSRDITTQYSFNADSGWKEWETDGNGNKTSYTYDGLGRITRVVEPDDDSDNNNNPTTWVSYNDDQLTALVVDPVGSKTFYVYDSFENVYAVIREDVAETITNYDSQKRLVWSSGPNNGYAPDGNAHDSLYRPITRYLYNNQGTKQETMITLPDGNTVEEEWDYLDNKQTVVDPLGNIKIQYLDMSDRVVKSIVYNGTEQLITCYYYDGMGNKTAVVENPHLNSASSDYRVTEYKYNAMNLVEEITSPGDNFYEWQGDNLVLVTDARPYQRFTYDKTGRTLSKTEQLSGSEELTVVKRYDQAGRLIEQKTPFNQEDILENRAILKIAITQYKYDNNGNETEKRESDAAVQEGVPVVNSTRVSSTTYYANNKPAARTDCEGNVETFSYYQDKMLKSRVDPRGYDNQALYPGYNGDFITNYYYDGLKKLVKEEMPRSADNTDKPVTRYSYYQNGNMKSKELPGQGTITYFYNQQDKPVTERTEGDGQQFFIRHEYDKAGNRIKSYDPRGNATRWEYDALNRVTKTIYPDNTYERYYYDKHNNKTRVIDRKGQETVYTFNSCDLNIATEDAYHNITIMKPDRKGNILEVVDAEDNSQKSQFNALGQVVYRVVNNEPGHRYQYNAYGNLEYYRDANNTLVAYTYTGNNQPLHMEYSRGSEQSIQDYWYDEAGFLKRVRGDTVVIDYNFTGSTYIPDSSNRVLSKTTYHDAEILGDDTVSAVLSYTMHYQYDRASRLTGIVYPRGEMVSCVYNQMGQLVSAENESGSYLAGLPVYDEQDKKLLRRVQAVNGITQEWDWDSNKRLERLAYSKAQLPVKSYAYQYDHNDNIIRINGNDYTYDALNRLTGMALHVEQTAANIALFQAVSGYTSDDYTGRKQLDFNLAAETTVKFDYAAAGIGLNLQEILPVSRIRLKPALQAHRVAPGQLRIASGLDNINYTAIDGWEGNKLANGEIELELAVPVAMQYIKVNCEFNDRDEAYAPLDNSQFYNTAGAIMEIEYAEKETEDITEVYTYDKIGNRLSLAMGGGTPLAYQYYTNASGKNTTRLKTDGTYACVYDGNGNLVQRGKSFIINGNEVTILTDAEYWDYSYDLQNRLVQVKKDGAVIAEYQYNPEDLRIKRSGAAITYYVYGPDEQLYYKEDATGNCERYIYLFNKHFAVEKGNTGSPAAGRYYYHTDHLGSVIALTDESGAVVWENEYKAFGAGIFENSAALTGLIYTGKEYDAGTGLYYFNARWYEAATGRFISADPAKDGINWYLYCRNNPLNLIDLTGLEPYSPVLYFANPKYHLPWQADHGVYLQYENDADSLGADLPLWRNIKTDSDYGYSTGVTISAKIDQQSWIIIDQGTFNPKYDNSVRTGYENRYTITEGNNYFDPVEATYLYHNSRENNWRSECYVTMGIDSPQFGQMTQSDWIHAGLLNYSAPYLVHSQSTAPIFNAGVAGSLETSGSIGSLNYFASAGVNGNFGLVQNSVGVHADAALQLGLGPLNLGLSTYAFADTIICRQLNTSGPTNSLNYGASALFSWNLSLGLSIPNFPGIEFTYGVSYNYNTMTPGTSNQPGMLGLNFIW